MTQVVGGGLRVTVALAAVLLLAVVALTTSAGQASGAVQLGLVGLLTAVILVAVVGALPSARIDNWTPFAPHGWSAIGTAGTVLMLSFVGWEAIAPMTARLRDRRTAAAAGDRARLLDHLGDLPGLGRRRGGHAGSAGG